MGREIISGVFWGGILSAVAVSVASLMGTEGGVPFRVPVSGLPFSLTTEPERVAEAPAEAAPALNSADSAEDTPATADVRLPGASDGAEEELALLSPDAGQPDPETKLPEDEAANDGAPPADQPAIAELPSDESTPPAAEPDTIAGLAEGEDQPDSSLADAASPPVDTADVSEGSGEEEPPVVAISDAVPPSVTARLVRLDTPAVPQSHLPNVAPEAPVSPGALLMVSLPRPALEIGPVGPSRASFAMAAGVAAPVSPGVIAAPQLRQRVDSPASQPSPAMAAAEPAPVLALVAEPLDPVVSLDRVIAPRARRIAPFAAVLPGETTGISAPATGAVALAALGPDALPYVPERRLSPDHLFAAGPQAPEIVDQFALIDPPFPSEDAPLARASAPELAQAVHRAVPRAPAPAPRARVFAAIGAPSLAPNDAALPALPKPEAFMRVAITGPSPDGPVTPHPDLPLLPSRGANPPPPENRTPPLFAGLLGAGSRLATAPSEADAPLLPGAFDAVALARPEALPDGTTDQAPGVTDRRGFDVALTVGSLAATNGAPGLPRLGEADRRLDRATLVALQAEPEPAPIVRTAHFEPPREATADVQVGDAPATLSGRAVLQSLGIVPGPEAPAPSHGEVVAISRAAKVPDLPQADTTPRPVAVLPAPQPEEAEDRPVLAALASEATAPSRAVASPDSADQVRVNRLPTIGQPASAATAARALEQYAARFENPEGLPVFSVILTETPDTAPEIDRIANLPLPVSMAVDPSLPGASERAAAYRAAGLEVVILAAFKEGDVASTFATFREALPQAVAVIEAGPGAWSTNRAQVGDLVSELAGTGHGLITYPKGLNSARQLADRAEVPSGLVARAVDPGKGPDVQRRALERAAFKAARDGAAIVVGQAVDETLDLLADWGTSRKTTQVALAPISQVLRAE